MASFTLFDKPLYAGIEPGKARCGRSAERADPVQGVQWQVLTAGGMRLSCTTPGALLSWPHDESPLLGVSLDGHGWRRADQFHGLVQRGAALEQAFYDSDWLE